MVLSVSSVLRKRHATAQIGLSDLSLVWKFDGRSTLRLDYTTRTMSRIDVFVISVSADGSASAGISAEYRRQPARTAVSTLTYRIYFNSLTGHAGWRCWNDLCHYLEQRGQEMLKITQQRDAVSKSMSLILEGKLGGPWVEELNSYWSQIFGNRQSVAVIDLTGVTFIDAEGKALLTRLWQQGAELRATGCLTKCVVEEITGSGRVDSSCRDRNKTI